MTNKRNGITNLYAALDVASGNKTPAVQRWLGPPPPFTMHFTPTFSSWLNLVERWFAELTNKWLWRGSHRSSKNPPRRSAPGSTTGTTTPSHSSGTRPPDEILDGVAAYCQRMNGSGHQSVIDHTTGHRN